MAEPLEYIAVGEALSLGGYALEGLGLLGTAVEAGAGGGLALETASAGALALETAGAGAGSGSGTLSGIIGSSRSNVLWLVEWLT